MAKVLLIGSLAQSLLTFRGDLLARLVGDGHEVVAAASQGGTGLIEKLSRMGVAYEELPLARTGLNPFADARTLWSLFRLCRRHRPDLVLSYTVKPVIYGSLCARLAGVPLISSMITGLGYAFTESPDGSLKKRLLNVLLRGLYRLSLRFNSVVFFQNRDDLELFRELGLIGERNHPTLIGGSGVNLEHYARRPAPQETGFVMISRLISEKGVREYVAAARRLKPRYPQVRFRLVGYIDRNPGAIRAEELEAWAAEGVIDYLGKLEDVRPVLTASSVFVLPTYYREGIPRTILEALSVGRPVITTDTPGCRETVVEGKNGFMVRSRCVDSLAAAMERFILTPGLVAAMGEESRRIALEKYDVNKVNQTIFRALGLQGLG